MGNEFSNQIRSMSMVADFWLIDSPVIGVMRCTMSGKNPSRVENLSVVDGLLYFKFRVMLLSSRARINPIRVTSRAVIFRCRGMVIWGTVEGVKL